MYRSWRPWLSETDHLYEFSLPDRHHLVLQSYIPLKKIIDGLIGEWKRGRGSLKKEIHDDRGRIKSLLPTPPKASSDPDLSIPSDL